MPMGDLPTKDITEVEPISEIDNPTRSIDWIKNNVVYEVNTRQFNNGGTFKSFMPEIPRIKALGVDVLWFMPVYPIGQLNRKGGLGSYYSIKNYHEINPEFGTMDDFKATVNAAHAQGMKVILDWVGNHTAWDHPWVLQHPDWYTHDANGNIVPPVPDNFDPSIFHLKSGKPDSVPVELSTPRKLLRNFYLAIMVAEFDIHQQKNLMLTPHLINQNPNHKHNSFFYHKHVFFYKIQY